MLRYSNNHYNWRHYNDLVNVMHIFIHTMHTFIHTCTCWPSKRAKLSTVSWKRVTSGSPTHTRGTSRRILVDSRQIASMFRVDRVERRQTTEFAHTMTLPLASTSRWNITQVRWTVETQGIRMYTCMRTYNVRTLSVRTHIQSPLEYNLRHEDEGRLMRAEYEKRIYWQDLVPLRTGTTTC